MHEQLYSPNNHEFPYKLGEEFIVKDGGSSELVFFYEKTIDLSTFNPGKPYFSPTLDMRNSLQFSYTNRGVNEKLRDPKGIEEFKRWNRNHEILPYLEQIQRTLQLDPTNVSESSESAYHGGQLFISNTLRDLFRIPVNSLEKMEHKGIYGRDNGVTYFTVDRDTAFRHAKGHVRKSETPGVGKRNNRFLLLTIDTKLMEKRNVFFDPESLTMEHEFKKNFVVHRGIPVSAMTRVDLIQFRDYRRVENKLFK